MTARFRANIHFIGCVKLRTLLKRGPTAAAATLATLAALVAAMTPAASAADELETFVMATNGQSTEATFRDPDPTFTNFDALGASMPSTAISNPSALAGAGIAGTWRLATSTTAPILTDSLSTVGSGVSGNGPWTYNGSTAVEVQQGQIRSESHALHIGNWDSFTVNTAESYGIMRDTFSVTSPGVISGSNGTMRIGMAFDGNMSVVGKGTVGVAFRYGYGATPVLNRTLLETFANIYGNGFTIYGPHSYLGSYVTPPGFSYNIGPAGPSGAPDFITFGGAGALFADVPITFGTGIDVRFGLYTFTGIGNGNGDMDVVFFHSATMTSIQIFDGGGNTVSNFSIASGSGTIYTASGAAVRQSSAAPEPTSLAFLMGGLLLLPGITTAMASHRTGRTL
jgi:hypothetical protein